MKLDTFIDVFKGADSKIDIDSKTSIFKITFWVNLDQTILNWKRIFKSNEIFLKIIYEKIQILVTSVTTVKLKT